jgi:hypothetical protein
LIDCEGDLLTFSTVVLDGGAGGAIGAGIFPVLRRQQESVSVDFG